MNHHLRHRLRNLIRYLLLRGHGWLPRKLPARDTREWQDPASGVWCTERRAIVLLKEQALALYDRKGQPRRPYSLRC